MIFSHLSANRYAAVKHKAIFEGRGEGGSKTYGKSHRATPKSIYLYILRNKAYSVEVFPVIQE